MAVFDEYSRSVDLRGVYVVVECFMAEGGAVAGMLQPAALSSERGPTPTHARGFFLSSLSLFPVLMHYITAPIYQPGPHERIQ